MVLLAMLTMLSGALAQPNLYRPESPDEIVGSISESVASLAAQARNSRNSEAEFDAEASLQSLFATFQLAQRENSARAYGHVLQLLDSWPADRPLPAAARLIKASVLQHNHRFGDALAELAQLPEDGSTLAPKLQMCAQILLIIGDYEEAAQTCAELRSSLFIHAALNCETQLLGLTGEAQQALATLSTLLTQPQFDPAYRLEYLLTSADIAMRLNSIDSTYTYYEKALALAPSNHYALSTFSDWLLSQGDHARVVELLEAKVTQQQDTELSILYARALVKQGASARYLEVKNRVTEEVAAMRKRGADRPHKLIAQYALYLAGDYELATHEALANFEAQKEPSDVLLLARAANAQGDHQALSRVKSWLTFSGLQSSAVEELVKAVGVRL